MHLAWPEDGTAPALEMLPQPLACARSRPVRAPQLEGRGPRDSELRLASLRPQVSSRPSTIAGSFPAAGTSYHTEVGVLSSSTVMQNQDEFHIGLA
jgi:hypothetical protein